MFPFVLLVCRIFADEDIEYCACQTENRQAGKQEGSRLAELKKLVNRMYGFERLSFVHSDYENNLNTRRQVSSISWPQVDWKSSCKSCSSDIRLLQQ